MILIFWSIFQILFNFIHDIYISKNNKTEKNIQIYLLNSLQETRSFLEKPDWTTIAIRQREIIEIFDVNTINSKAFDTSNYKHLLKVFDVIIIRSYYGFKSGEIVMKLHTETFRDVNSTGWMGLSV